MFQALRIRDFRLLWGGSVISALGTWLLVLAIPAHVLLVTGSLRDTGLTLAAQYLPALILGPVAGVLTDRWDRRRLMIATSLFRAGAVAVMLLGTTPGRYWVLYAALIAESSAGVLYLPAWQARTPAIFGTGTLLSSANSLNALADGAVRLIGGQLGGILLAAVGVRWLILADAVSYLASAAANTATSRPSAPAARPANPGSAIAAVARDLAEGTRVLRAEPVARALLAVTVIFLAANAALSAMLIPLGIRRLGGGENTGFVLSALGVGFLLAAPLLRALLDRAQPRILLTVTLAATAAGQFGLFTSTSLVTALPAAVASGRSADRPAARHPQRRPRPDQRRLPDRRGRRRPARRTRRSLPGPGHPPDRPGHRSQPDHPRRRRPCPPRRPLHTHQHSSRRPVNPTRHISAANRTKAAV